MRPTNSLAIAIFVLLLTGCGGSGNPTDPSGQVLEERTLSNGDSVVFPTSGARIEVDPDSFFPGVTVNVGVEVDPADLPEEAFSGNRFFAKVTSVTVADVDNSNEPINPGAPLTVTHPIRSSEVHDLLSNNENLKLFFFDRLAGRWIDTANYGYTSDTLANVSFAANRFGTFGVFKPMALEVDASASRTTGKAPFSVSLQAVIKGGVPPYVSVWHFGDDNDPEAGIFVSHLYELPITYVPSVLVTDASGTQVEDHIELYVH